jgi:hypothetical protein
MWDIVSRSTPSTRAQTGKQIIKRQLRARVVLQISLAAVGRVGRGPWPERLLHLTQVKADQSVGEKHGRYPAGTSKPVNGRFADLQNFGELTRGQVLSSLVLGRFQRFGLAGLRVWFLSLGSQLFLHRFE